MPDAGGIFIVSLVKIDGYRLAVQGCINDPDLFLFDVGFNHVLLISCTSKKVASHVSRTHDLPT